MSKTDRMLCEYVITKIEIIRDDKQERVKTMALRTGVTMIKKIT